MRRLVAAVAVVAAAGSVSCGAAGHPDATGRPLRSIIVLAASSLANVFPTIGRAFEQTDREASVTFSFAGTDSLAAQIEQGAPADVFAGASLSYGDLLASRHLIRSPSPFATNRLVLVVPPSNPGGIRSAADLVRPVRLVIGDPSVPIGAYTRTVLANLNRAYGRSYSTRVLANVVSQEQDAGAVLAKVRLGEADAGFVYVTDAGVAGAAVRAIGLPSSAQAVVTYPIAVIRATGSPAPASEFVRFVLSPAGQRSLRAAGFGPPPAG